MSDTNQLQAAIDRLRRVKAGEDMRSVYGTRLWLQSRVLWKHDHKMLADAYLELGTRQMEVVMRSTDGKPTSIVTSFIREADWLVDIERRVDAMLSDGFLEDEEVPNAD